jgi:hypothetical protein
MTESLVQADCRSKQQELDVFPTEQQALASDVAEPLAQADCR